MTLSPQDKERMEKANPYIVTNGIHAALGHQVFNEGYTAAVKDRDCLQERNDELTTKVDRLQTALRAIDDETLPAYARDEIRIAPTPQPADMPKEKMKIGQMGAYGSFPPVAIKMITDKEVTFGDKNGNIKTVCRELAEKYFIHANTPCSECKGTGEHAGGRYRNGADAGIQCPECGTVGSGGVVEIDTTRWRDDMKTYATIPCSRCGTADTPSIKPVYSQ